MYRTAKVSVLLGALVLLTINCSGKGPSDPPPPPPPPPPAPAVDVQVNSQSAPVTLTEPAEPMVSWSSQHANTCNAFGSWSGARNTEGGAMRVGPLTAGTYQYGVSCTNTTATARDSVDVTVEAPPPPPPSTRVLFAAGSDFFLAPLQGGEEELLVTGGGQRVFPAPSPNRERIVYIGEGSCHNAEPFISPRDLSTRTALPCVHEGGAQSPVFSPSGTHVAFQAADNVQGFTNTQLSAFIASADGASARQISAFHTCQSSSGPPPCFAHLNTIYVTFTPSGEVVTTLLEITGETSHNNVVVNWNSTTGALARVRTFSSARLIETYDVSTDGEWIAATGVNWRSLNDEQVLLIRTDGSEVRELTGRDGSQWPFFCGQDDELVNFVRRDAPRTIVHVDRQGSPAGKTTFEHDVRTPRCF